MKPSKAQGAVAAHARAARWEPHHHPLPRINHCSGRHSPHNPSPPLSPVQVLLLLQEEKEKIAAAT